MNLLPVHCVVAPGLKWRSLQGCQEMWRLPQGRRRGQGRLRTLRRAVLHRCHALPHGCVQRVVAAGLHGADCRMVRQGMLDEEAVSERSASNAASCKVQRAAAGRS